MTSGPAKLFACVTEIFSLYLFMFLLCIFFIIIIWLWTTCFVNILFGFGLIIIKTLILSFTERETQGLIFLSGILEDVSVESRGPSATRKRCSPMPHMLLWCDSVSFYLLLSTVTIKLSLDS